MHVLSSTQYDTCILDIALRELSSLCIFDTAADSFENMSDLFVRAWPEGCDYQDTDTHWRAKKGRDLRLTRLLFVYLCTDTCDLASSLSGKKRIVNRLPYTHTSNDIY